MCINVDCTEYYNLMVSSFGQDVQFLLLNIIESSESMNEPDSFDRKDTYSLQVT